MAKIGVQIELEGAPQYKENMANLTAQTKLYQAQLKRLDAEMSSGASAFQKSITQSKALQQQLEAQTNQSKLLEEQIAKATEQYGEDSTQVIRLKTQYENLQAAIAKTNKALEENGGLAGAIGAQFQEVGNKISAVGDKMTSIGTSLSTKITAPIVAMGAASYKAFTEVDTGLDTIIAKTGASGDALKEMEGIMNNIATSIPASFEEAGNAVGEVNTRFGVTGDELEDLSKQFVEFAKLNGTDVSSSIDSVQAAMAAFGVDTKNAGDVLDILNKAGQNTGISMDTLSNSLLSNASSLTEMGFNINSAAGLISSLEKNGVDASAAMSGLKKAFTNASSEGKSLDQAMAELQDVLANSTNDMDAYNAAMDLFGNKAGPQIAKAVREGRLSFDEATNAVKDYAGSLDSTFEATLDPMDQMQVNMNKLKIVGADLVNAAAPMITKAMEKMSDVITKLSDAWNSLDEGQQERIVKIAGLAAAIGPLLVVGGKLTSGIGSMVTNIGTLITKIGPLMTSIGATAPMILGIVAAVGALIAIFVALYKNNEDFREKVQGAWQGISDFISNTCEQIKAIFSSFMELLSAIWTKYGDEITLYVTAVFEVIKTVINTAMTVIKAVIDTIIAVINGDWKTAWENIKLIFSTVWNGIKSIVSTIFTTVVTIIQNKIQQIIAKFTSMKNSVVSVFTNLINSALSWGKDFVQGFVDGITAKMQALIDKVKSMAETVKSYLHFSEPDKGPLKDFNTWPRDMMEQYAAGIEAARYLVKDAVTDVAADVAVLANPLSADDMYSAIRAGASDATLKLSIGDREFSRSLRDMGVAFNG